MIKDWKQFASELVSTLEDLLSQRLLFLDDGSLLEVDLNLVDDLSGRGTKMTSLRYVNTMEGDRSIYIEDSQMMFIIEYHKSMVLMDEVKVC